MAILERHDQPVTLNIAGHEFKAKKLAAFQLDSAVNDLSAKVIGPMEFYVRALYEAIKEFNPDETLEGMKNFFTLSDINELQEELKKVGIDFGKKKVDAEDTIASTQKILTGPILSETQDGASNT